MFPGMGHLPPLWAIHSRGFALREFGNTLELMYEMSMQLLWDISLEENVFSASEENITGEESSLAQQESYSKTRKKGG